MAVDTRVKRESAMLEGFVVPDGTIAAPDRLAATWHYSGIAAAAAAVIDIAQIQFRMQPAVMEFRVPEGRMEFRVNG